MAFATTDIDALKAAIASGALQVRFADGRQVMYRSLAEMRQILRMIEGETSSTSTQRTSVAGF